MRAAAWSSLIVPSTLRVTELGPRLCRILRASQQNLTEEKTKAQTDKVAGPRSHGLDTASYAPPTRDRIRRRWSPPSSSGHTNRICYLLAALTQLVPPQASEAGTRFVLISPQEADKGDTKEGQPSRYTGPSPAVSLQNLLETETRAQGWWVTPRSPGPEVYLSCFPLNLAPP